MFIEVRALSTTAHAKMRKCSLQCTGLPLQPSHLSANARDGFTEMQNHSGHGAQSVHSGDSEAMANENACSPNDTGRKVLRLADEIHKGGDTFGVVGITGSECFLGRVAVGNSDCLESMGATGKTNFGIANSREASTAPKVEAIRAGRIGKVGNKSLDTGRLVQEDLIYCFRHRL